MAVGEGKGVSVRAEIAVAVGVGITVDTGAVIVDDGVVSEGEGVGATQAASAKAVKMMGVRDSL